MRKWIVRGLVFSVAAALAGAATLYALWTNPVAVRQMVEEKLGVRLVRVAVTVESARLRLLGGILVRGLRLARSEGLERTDFLYVPEAVLYHDKEHMLDGKVLIRKVELTRPQLRIVRERDGRFNLREVLGHVDLSERVPTMVIRDGTLVFEDRAAGPQAPLLEVKNVQMTLVNDPLPALQIEGTGQTDVLGPVRFRANVPRATLAAGVELELTDVPVGPELVRRAGLYCPAAVTHLERLSGRAEVTAKLQFNPETDRAGTGSASDRVVPGPLRYDIKARLRQGRLQHPALPVALERIDLSARLLDGRVPLATLTATAGPARINASVTDLELPAGNIERTDLDALARSIDLSAEKLPVTPALLARLPEALRFIQADYAPAGPVSVRYTFRRADRQPPRKQWLIQPEGMTASFIHFPYPLRGIQGTIQVDASNAPLHDVRIDLSGQGGEHPVALRGSVTGDRKTGAVALDITGRNVLLDDRIYRALPPRVRKVAMEFLPEPSRRLGLDAAPMGRADVHVELRRACGQDRLDKRFIITFRQSKVKYDQFPYPLEGVSGVLTVHPDHWECKNFRGRHAGGELFVEGRSYRLPGRAPLLPDGSEASPPEQIHLDIRGQDVLLDREFEEALVPGGGKPPGDRRALQNAWRSLAVAGRLSFKAEVLDTPGQPQDLDVRVDVQGCSMKPTFFDYALDQVTGSVHYLGGKVYLRDMRARHGGTELALNDGLVQTKPGGGFLAWLRRLSGRAVLADEDLLAAVPEPMRRGLQTLRLRSPVDVNLALTIDATAGPQAPVKLWWDGGALLHDASFHTGVEVQGATGQYHCRGYHNGRTLRDLKGNLVLERANVLGQPVTQVHAHLEVLPDSPDVLRIRDLKGDLFGGTVAGEARIEMAPVLRYEVLLEALGVQLGPFGRHNLGPAGRQAQLQGPARAALHLMGEGNDLLGLKGNGRIDVVGGKMGQLPVLLDLLKAFGLRMPDRTAFEEAHLLFAVEGPRLHVKQFDLFGNAISLRGQGSADLDGSNLNLDFTATPGQFGKLLPPGIHGLQQLISQQVLKIKMRGKLGKDGQVRFDKELMPAVVEPIKRAISGN